jgi:outer membrane protein TolC
MRLLEDIRKIEYQLSLFALNIELAEENITLFRERLSRGQATGYDLISQEIDLQQQRSAYNELKTELLRNQVEWFKNAGYLDQLIRKFQ